jgi:cation channel sperm-associated protein 2
MDQKRENVHCWGARIDAFVPFWRDGWNVFDFVITLFSLLPEVLSLVSTSGALDSGLPKLVRQLRVLRALRSFKMISKFGTLKVSCATVYSFTVRCATVYSFVKRSLKCLPACLPATQVIIATILETFSSIGNIMLLLVIVMYIYGVVACHLFEHYSLSAA